MYKTSMRVRNTGMTTGLVSPKPILLQDRAGIKTYGNLVVCARAAP
jgi:hypothetical protein